MQNLIHQPHHLRGLLLVIALAVSGFTHVTHAYEHEFAAFNPECEFCEFGLHATDSCLPQHEFISVLPPAKATATVATRQLSAGACWWTQRPRAPPLASIKQL